MGVQVSAHAAESFRAHLGKLAKTVGSKHQFPGLIELIKFRVRGYKSSLKRKKRKGGERGVLLAWCAM